MLSLRIVYFSSFWSPLPQGLGALVVNPYYADAVAEAVHEALNMSRNKKHIVHERLHQYVREYTSELWAERILRGLVETSRDSVRDRRLYTGGMHHGDYSISHLHHGVIHHPGHYRHGMHHIGLHHTVGMHGGVSMTSVCGLDLASLRASYERTTRRLLVRASMRPGPRPICLLLLRADKLLISSSHFLLTNRCSTTMVP